MKYWVERWSELRMKEMIHYPKNFLIHNDYLKNGRKKISEMDLVNCLIYYIKSTKMHRWVQKGCFCLPMI